MERVVLGEDNVEDEVVYEALFEGQGVFQFRKRWLEMPVMQFQHTLKSAWLPGYYD